MGKWFAKETPAACKEAMTEKSWNVTGYAGKNAQLRLIGHYSGYWGHINFYHLQACHKLTQTRILEFSWLSIKLEKLCKIKNIVRTTSKFLFLISNPPLHKFFDLILQLVRIYSSLR